MPYIRKEDRKKFEPLLKIAEEMCWPGSAGELNYLITSLCIQYIKSEGSPMGYGIINEVMGALECCRLELYRRLAAPYEIEKCSQNGDVY